ncbi:uncharacterized protein LTR77_004059 [Saxophila tyrrhenica]|uniref:Methyltransferase n=1 Tax=Saxophila tyrrhenica TaxID=1690608 RepID=A0AAV9PFY4_9PEZI|nr:hypothetical protein LTR77_004059 [Saxophila tyrrhenica]
MRDSHQAPDLRIEYYQWEGRRYCMVNGGIAYQFPWDEIEWERLDMIHCLIHDHALDKRSYISPLDASSGRAKILDVGCGTGIFCYDVGEANPNFDVIGIDLADGPKGVAIPNVQIMTPVDFNLPEWPLRPHDFDLIRNAHLNGSVTNWEQHLRKCFHYLKSGGFFEHIDIDFTPRLRLEYTPPRDELVAAGGYQRWQEKLMEEIRPVQEWWHLMQEASHRMGRPLTYPSNMEEMLENAGFDRTHHETFRIHMVPPPVDGDIREEDGNRAEVKMENLFKGAMFQFHANRANRPVDLEGLTMYLLTQYCNPPRSVDEVRKRCADVARICNSRRRPVYFNL